MDPIDIRPAAAPDEPLLWRFLALAAYEPSAEAARAQPLVALHLGGWPGPRDFGFIASQRGQAIGAAWARQHSPAEQPSVYLDADTPEVSIAVAPAHTGAGIGRALLSALQVEATRRGLKLCLTVRDSNPALRLYERLGFVRLPGAEVRNRVGGWSIAMGWPGGPA